MRATHLKATFLVLSFSITTLISLPGCSQGTGGLQATAGVTDISADVYKLLVKELFADLSTGPEVSEIKNLTQQNQSSSSEQKYQAIKKIAQLSKQLDERLLNKLKSFGSPATVKQKHQQITSILEDLFKSSEKLNQLLPTSRDELLTALKTKPTAFRSDLLDALKTFIKPGMKSSVQSLSDLGVSFQTPETGILKLQISQFWEKSDEQVAKDLEKTVDMAMADLNNLSNTVSTNPGNPTSNPKPTESSLPHSAEDDKALFQVIQDNANALNSENLNAYEATLHPDSTIKSYIPDAFKLLIKYKTKYKLNELEVKSMTATSATVMVNRATTDASGTVDQYILYTLRKSNSSWKIYSLTNE